MCRLHLKVTKCLCLQPTYWKYIPTASLILRLKQFCLISLEINRIFNIVSYSSLKAKKYNTVVNNNPFDAMHLIYQWQTPKILS